MADRSPEPLTPARKDAFKNACRPPRAPLTDKDKVRAVLGEIQEKRNAGWSYEEVRQELAKTVGFKGSLKTLYCYIWQLSAGQTKPAAPATPASGAPALPALVVPPGSTPTSSPLASDFVPDPARRHYIHNLGGEHVRAARRQSAEENSKRPSLVEILNKPI